jgi:SAM-dependent methyltransferase
MEIQMKDCPLCNDRLTDLRRHIKYQGDEWFKCQSCRGGFKIPYIPEVDDKELGREHYDKEYLKPSFHDRRLKFANKQANWIMASYKPGMSVLEIGPGLGLAASVFLQRVPDVPYYVIEAHEWFADYILSQQGNAVHILRGEVEELIGTALEEASNRGRKPIIVYLDQVLEHIPYPFKLLKFLKENLPAGSKILLDVPNEHGVKVRHYIYQKIGAQTTVSPCHINHFTKNSFLFLLSKLGLRAHVYQRCIREPEDINCLPDWGSLTKLILLTLKIFPVDRILNMGNNLRVEIDI